MTKPRPIYVFVHLSKTGGTTLYKHLLNFFTNEEELVYLGPEGDSARKHLGKPPLSERSDSERRRVRVLIGHKVKLSTLELVPWRQPRLIFFMRHPASRMISKYNYQMYLEGRQENPIPFDKWRADLKPNAWDTAFWLCRRFLDLPATVIRDIPTRQKIADQLLRQFYLVSTTERMDEDAALVFQEMGIPNIMQRENVGGRDHKVLLKSTPDLSHQICREFSTELDFYEKWSSIAPYHGRPGKPQIDMSMGV